MPTFFHDRKTFDKPIKKKLSPYLPTHARPGSPAHTALVDQMQYELPRAIIKREMELRGLIQESEIWIYPFTGDTFEAVVAVKGEIYVYFVEGGNGELVDTVPCKGVRENGSLIY